MTDKKRFSFLSELLTALSAIMGVAILWIMLFHSGIQAPDNTVLRALWYLFVSFWGALGLIYSSCYRGSVYTILCRSIQKRKASTGGRGARSA